MRSLIRYALGVGAAMMSLAGCTGSQLQLGLPAAPANTHSSIVESDADEAATLRVIYSFDRGSHGYGPDELTTMNGRLYDTAAFGGKSNNGVVFELSPTGKQRVLYSFKGSPDGANPNGGLVALDGNLYGTTTHGGAYGAGTVFEITPVGGETILHSFRGGRDGATPAAPPVMLASKLYGTTLYGGNADQDGTVYEVTPAGAERIIHHFGSRGQDYATGPVGGLAALNGILFGTAGGAKGSWGVAFSLTPGGEYHNIHGFNYFEGAEPAGTLITYQGSLYGDTAGQIDQHDRFHGGVVFELNPSGRFRIVARVGKQIPEQLAGRLTVLNNAFYGVIVAGGKHGDGGIFEVTMSGKERLICSFQARRDGHRPGAPTALNGNLFGTLWWGGPGGGGTVVKVQP